MNFSEVRKIVAFLKAKDFKIAPREADNLFLTRFNPESVSWLTAFFWMGVEPGEWKCNADWYWPDTEENEEDIFVEEIETLEEMERYLKHKIE